MCVESGLLEVKVGYLPYPSLLCARDVSRDTGRDLISGARFGPPIS